MGKRKKKNGRRREVKPKKYEEVKIEPNKMLSDIKRDYKIQTVLIVIVSILALIVCFKLMSLAIDYEALKIEKEALEDITETQSSMISDLEANCKDLFIQVEELKYGEQR